MTAATAPAPAVGEVFVMSHAQDDPRHMLRIEATLADLAGRQCGVFSSAEAGSRGVTKQQLERRLHSGFLVRCHPRVYALRGSPDDWLKRATAAVKWAGSGSALSHRSAGRVWEIYTPGLEAPVEVTCVRRKRPREGIKAYTLSAWRPGDICRWKHLVVTTPVRTIIDLACTLDSEPLLDALEDALVKGLFTLERLNRRLDGNTQGRRGTRSLKSLISGLQGGDLLPRSHLERKYLRESKRLNVPAARLQFPVVAEGQEFFIDFAYPEHMLAVEMDGWQFHGGRSNWEADVHRSNQLVGLGWRVVRGTWRDLQERPQEFVGRIADLLTPKLGTWVTLRVTGVTHFTRSA